MAPRQRARAPRTSTASPSGSGGQLSGIPGSAEASSTEQDRAALRAGFDPSQYEGLDKSSRDAEPAPRATFVGEQLPHKSREARIAELAYLRSERRGFVAGYELDDWLEAEKEVNALMASGENEEPR